MKKFTFTKILISAFLILVLSCFSAAAEDTFSFDYPQPVTNAYGRFPQVLRSGTDSYVFWQEVNTSAKKIQLSCIHYSAQTENIMKPGIKRLMGTFDYSGEVPDIFTAQINNQGTVLVAAPSGSGITIFTSTDKCETFYKKVIRTPKTAIGARCYITSKGSFRLFYSLVDEVERQVQNPITLDTETETEQIFNLYYMDSSDGIIWAEQKQLELTSDISNPFVPSLIPFKGGDLVIFQAQKSTGLTSENKLKLYQLFKTVTYDNGATWSKPVLVSPASTATSQDQSPYLLNYSGNSYLVWERSSGENTYIYFSALDSNGNIGNGENISKGSGKASRGKLFEYHGALYLVWFESNNGKIQLRRLAEDGKFLTEKINIGQDKDTKFNGNLFPSPLILTDSDGSESLNFICQNNGRIAIIGPDRTVGLPVLTPKSYRKGKRSSSDSVEINVTYPDDVSGIKGYIYTWAIENNTAPDKNDENNRILVPVPVKLTAKEDGIYTLRLLIQDNAGNWSDPDVSVDYYHDITPPSKPELKSDFLDDYGFVKSNEFAVDWLTSMDENKRTGTPTQASGYNYELEYLGKIPSSLAQNKTHSIYMSRRQVQNELDKLTAKYSKKLKKNYRLKSSIIATNSFTKKYVNQENGVYRFSVAAIDEVGNVSETTTILLFINKYKPETVINKVSIGTAKDGGLEGRIYGEGFTYEGIINKIYIDKDGKRNSNGKYDLELSRENGDFKVSSDTLISNIKIGTALDEGKYKVGIVHTDRGLYWARNSVSFEKSGTIVYIPEYEYKPKYEIIDPLTSPKIIALNIVITVIIAALVILVALIIFTVLSAYSREKILIQEEINSLARGENMPLLQNKKRKQNQKSLKTRIVLFTVILIMLVVGGITAVNVKQTLESQSETLSSSFLNQVDVLLGSIDSGVTTFMPDSETANLQALPDQSAALEEAEYITILGHRNSSETALTSEQIKENPDLARMIYIWGSNDPDWNEKTDNSDSPIPILNAGISKIIIPQSDSDKTNADLYKIILGMDNLNQSTIDKLNTYSTQITSLNKEMDTIIDQNDYDNKSDTKNSVQKELDSKFSEIEAENSGSVPQFRGISLNMNTTEYLFYRPVLYRDEVDENGNLENVLCGLVVMQTNVQDLQDNLKKEVSQILISGLIIAVIAIIAGALGSWILASIIVRPIRKLETHIQEVGNLLTKSARERMRLQKMEIEVKTRDEIGRLGEVVNKMSSTVAKAAEDEYLNMDARVVQERFVPLSDGEGGKKLPFIQLEEEKLNIFAFYKGDSEVSGDYFDYKELDERWIVFIKCDVSGHGTPAALLVSVIATKFKEFYYYGNWNYKENGINLVQFVSAVNDFIYDLGTRGKFSTINISLYNKDTGELYTCNAGDNKLDLYESDKHRLRRITLANSPTAGGLSTDLIMMNGGFKVERTQIRHGDILYLYTDGIDEAERLVRNKDFSVKQERKETVKFNPRLNKEEKTVQILDVKEQFGEDRVRRVIEAVLNRRKFILDKQENPAREILEFNFTNCKGTYEESILALAAVERVFRFVKTPDVKSGDEVEIEKKVDDFLKAHFALYNMYCRPQVLPEDQPAKKSKKKKDEVQTAVKVEDNPNDKRYSYLVEDKQADDITLVAIYRP